MDPANVPLLKGRATGALRREASAILRRRCSPWWLAQVCGAALLLLESLRRGTGEPVRPVHRYGYKRPLRPRPVRPAQP